MKEDKLLPVPLIVLVQISQNSNLGALLSEEEKKSFATSSGFTETWKLLLYSPIFIIKTVKSLSQTTGKNY